VADSHGVITPSGDIRVLRGDSIVFTFVPDMGYQVDSLIVDDSCFAAESSFLLHVDTNHTIRITFKVVNSMQAVEWNEKIFISPNPAQYHICIASSDPALTIGNVSVYDLNGRHICAVSAVGSQTDFFVGNLTSGIYILTIETSKGTLNKRFEKQ
jgi:hypothetical protein